MMRHFPLGVDRGLKFDVILHPVYSPEVYLEGAITRSDSLSREHRGPRAVLNAVERLASEYGAVCASTQRELSIDEAQLRDYQARLGKPFTHGKYLEELAALRDQLKTGLSGAEPKEGAPTVAQVAEQIKALRATQTIETAPQRTGKRQSSAEEPVTARIKRKAEEASDSEETRHQDRIVKEPRSATGRA
jgi:hypothetical protein